MSDPPWDASPVGAGIAKPFVYRNFRKGYCTPFGLSDLSAIEISGKRASFLRAGARIFSENLLVDRPPWDQPRLGRARLPPRRAFQPHE
jgi:hypothetical protein